jgi:hypothetical protein
VRQRTKRDLIAALGVVVVLIGVWLVNDTFNRGALAAQKDKERRHWEGERRRSGMEVLRWEYMRDTAGSLRSGPTFSEELKQWENKQVNVIGFMVPENEFRDIKEFMLLPLPIECYFCKRPPMHDVMHVVMEEGTSTNLWEQPVLINGVLRLHPGPNDKYFYTIEHAALASAEEGATLQRRYIDPEHMLPQHNEEVKLEQGIDLTGDN